MNTRNLLVSVLMLVCVLLSACAPAVPATQVPTSLPPTAAPTAIPPTADLTGMSSPKTFKLPMSLRYGGDWQVRYDLPGKFAIDHQHNFGLSFYIVTDAKLVDPIDGHLIPFGYSQTRISVQSHQLL